MTLTLNIIHTNYGDHHLFTLNNKLREQLPKLAKIEDLSIQVLFNGDDTFERFKEDSLPEGVIKCYNKERLTHGSSQQFLSNHTPGWCIFIDEDDEFCDDFENTFAELIKIIPNLDPSKLYTYYFNWYYISPNTGKLKKLLHPTKDENGKLQPESICGLSNWNLLLYAPNQSGWFKRCDINQYDDVLWYHTIYQYYNGEAILLPYTLINYHKENATMSKNPDEKIEKILNYVLKSEILKITEF